MKLVKDDLMNDSCIVRTKDEIYFLEGSYAYIVKQIDWDYKWFGLIEKESSRKSLNEISKKVNLAYSTIQKKANMLAELGVLRKEEINKAIKRRHEYYLDGSIAKGFEKPYTEQLFLPFLTVPIIWYLTSTLNFPLEYSFLIVLGTWSISSLLMWNKWKHL